MSSLTTLPRVKSAPSTGRKPLALDTSHHLQTSASGFGLGVHTHGTGGSNAGSPGAASNHSGNSALEEKVQRKRAEVDLQLLANRIALLRAEEQRALSKVSETKERAKEILDIKRRNEQQSNDKLTKNITRENAIKEAQARATAEREARKRRLASNKKIIEDTKKAQALEKKRETARQFEQQNQARAQFEEDLKQRALEEKRRQQIIRQQREKEKAAKERELQRAAMEKHQEEMRRRKEAEALIDALEREEKDLIVRLRQTQTLQQRAYETLQRSLES